MALFSLSVYQCVMKIESDKLAEIVAHKWTEVEAIKGQEPKLKAAALERNDFRGFRAALDRGEEQLGVIAEVKQASPSAGIIDADFNAVQQANLYIQGGASCMSILTDEKFFKGSLADFVKISKTSPIPLLRKDFTVDEVQIYEAIVAGADAVLLIVAALDDEALKRLFNTAKDLQLDVLVEVHDLQEMERALDLDGIDLLGINNRNLKTFVTDLSVTEALAEEVPEDVLLVSESGLKNATDGQRVLEAGANAILVGESLMRATTPQEGIQNYLNLVVQAK